MKTQQAVSLKQENAVAEWPRHVLRLVIVVMALSLLSWLLVTLRNPQTLPIKMVRAQGTFSHVSEAMLQKAVGQVSGGYFNVDVNQVQLAVEKLPWVAQASVRRIWPDTLAISVNEQKAMAYWNAQGLVNMKGEIFAPDKSSYPKMLPHFKGPAGMNEMVTEYYLDAQQRLKPLGLLITGVTLDDRRSLMLQINHNLELVLGKEKKTKRLERFVRIYPKTLSDKINRIARVDLRYPHGMAIEWKKDPVKTQNQG